MMTGGKNSTAITKFILVGFSDFPKLRLVLFIVFLGIYLSTVVWNLGLIMLIRIDPYLHTPMYFFLSNLSFLDFWYISSTTPKMLSGFFQRPKSISFLGCTIQYFFFSSLGLAECCLLAAMAYDRYAAICNPLLYTAIMAPSLCVQMVVGAYVTGLFGSLIQLCAILQLHFCGPNVINHFFCDLPQLLVLSCSETFPLQVLKFVIAVIFGVASVLVILISYTYIVATILKISSIDGRNKAFNTCASHLTAVTLFFGSGLFVYMRPSSDSSQGYDKMASIFYTVLIPMLNPLIYSLRNKDIKDALKRYKSVSRRPDVATYLFVSSKRIWYWRLTREQNSEPSLEQVQESEQTEPKRVLQVKSRLSGSYWCMAGAICTMKSFIVIILIWTTVVCAETDKLLGDISETGFRKCQNALNIPVLEVLPGGGWDNLRNIDMGRVMDLTYTNCKTTEDGQYIIPDEVFTIPQKESNLEMNSEILDSWVNYRSTTSSSINMGLDSPFKVNGKFSTEFQRMKTLQVKDHAVTARVQVRNLVYTVKNNPNSELSLGFKRELMEICDHLEKNQTKMATYLAELLVLNYGTHVITSVDAGAALVQEDHIKSSFLKNNEGNHAAVTVSAGITFSKMMNFKTEANLDYKNELTRGYLENRTNSRMQSIGGVPYYPGITLEIWQKGITNHLVAVDRAGLPLHFFIKPDKLPGFPIHLVEKLSKTVEVAARNYYTFNTYPGCTNVDSPNFNFQANTDDGSCDGKVANSPFGGVYQVCSQSTWHGKLCPKLEQKNPLTGDFSCPSGYTPVHLVTQTHEEGFRHRECKKKCTLKIFCKTVCEDVFRVAKAEFKAYWCVAHSSQVPENSGLLFGGVFTDKSTNPVTNEQSCPNSYLPLSLLGNLKVCVSMDHELGHKFSIPFGGFFSCTTGNPLVDSSTSKDVGEGSFPQKCPGGFSQQLAVIRDGCQVSYCVKAGVFTKASLAPVRLPPYTQPPIMSQSDAHSIEEPRSESAKSWIQDSHIQEWRLEEPSKRHSSGISGGSIAAITVGAILALAILTALAIYGNRRFKKNEHKGIARARATPDGV
ncbi:hypothetical protein STEG23_025954 [Scotinomys teguina]